MRYQNPIRVAGLFLNEPAGHQPQGKWHAAGVAAHLSENKARGPLTPKGADYILKRLAEDGFLSARQEQATNRVYYSLRDREGLSAAMAST